MHLHRKTHVGLVATFLVAIAGCRGVPVIDERPPPPGAPTVVLVHGSWHTSKTWRQVTKRLDERGVAWVAVNLPSTNPEPAFFLPGLAEDVAATEDAINRIDGPVLLVGHSYGGMVVSGAGLDHRVAEVLYLCAFIPGVGESLVGISMGATGPPPALNAAVQLDIFAGLTAVDPSLATEALFHDVEPAIANTAVDALVPSTMAAGRGSLDAVAWMHKPARAIVCSADEAIPLALQRAMAAQLRTEPVEVKSSHSAALSSPAFVANAIVEAVERIRNRQTPPL